jgi:capsular exopolysaccharide synthesis family protein
MTRQHLRRFKDRWRLIVAGLLLGLAAGFGVTYLSAPTYSASVTLYISSRVTDDDVVDVYHGGLLSEQRVKSYARIVTSPRVTTPVAEHLGMSDGGAALAKQLSVTAEPDTVLLTISGTAHDADTAVRIADAVGAEFINVVAELEQPDAAAPVPQVVDTNSRSARSTTPAPVPVPLQPPVRARVLSAATSTGEPVAPSLLLNLWLFGVVGGLLGVAAASMRSALDTSVKDPNRLEELVGAPRLASIAYDGDTNKRPLSVRDRPQSRQAEAFRQLRTNLQFVDLDQSRKVLVFTSAVAGEGKSVTVCNLAAALATSGARVLVVETDLRRPRVADYLGLERQVGLTTVLTGRAGLDEAMQSWGGGLFDVLCAGSLPPNPSEVLGSRQMTALLDGLRRRYEIILLDATPLLAVSDAAVLAAAADGVILTCRYGKTSEGQVSSAAQALERVSARVLGTVLTMVPRGRERAYTQYKSFASTGKPGGGAGVKDADWDELIRPRNDPRKRSDVRVEAVHHGRPTNGAGAPPQPRPGPPRSVRTN